VQVRLERLDAEGTWSLPDPGDQVTVASRAPREHTWLVEPGRYRAVVQRLDHRLRPVGAPLFSSEVVVTAGGTTTSAGGTATGGR
jgi:hypothetical protein